MSANPFPTPIHAEGIHFGMSDDDYHKDPSFSYSGCKSILVSELEYWLNSRLNPEFEDKPTDAMIFGRALHCYLLEGAEEFTRRFAIEPRPKDYPGAIDGAKALRAHATSIGVSKPGRSIEELCLSIRTREAEKGLPESVLWPLIEAEFNNQVDGRAILSSREGAELKLGMYVLAHMPSVARAFSGGYSEVALFWRDKETGVPMKAKIDYLRHSAIADPKTFTNKLRLPVKQAAVRAIYTERYDLQPPVYLDGLKAVHELYQEHGDKVVFGEVDPDWLKRLMAAPPERFVFVLLQKGGTPEVVSREWRRTERKGGSPNGHFIRGERDYRKAVKLYARCVAELGTDQPWIVDRPTTPLFDHEFPLHALAQLDDVEEEVAA